MKYKYLKIAFLAIAANSTVAMADFQVACKVFLSGNSGTTTLVSNSQTFSNTILGYGQSNTSIYLGSYTLVAGMMMNQPFGSSSPMQPTFSMTLFKDNPIQGQINTARIQGMELDKMPTDSPLRIFGNNFLNFSYNGQQISRVDYHCSISNLQ